ncbi:DMT family transporter [Devosia sp.]|uniref:DMT family transporter n=1 Tax=Devosia sp. TaxID=1871048 RepID=UPI002AFF8A90|nr:DMT family transporter [Devosia sp.]
MTAPHTADKPLRGILLILGATLMFAYNDSTNKILLTDYNAPLVTGIRYIVHTLLMLAIVAPLRGRDMFQTRRTGLVLVRAACLAMASLLLGFALQLMPVAETTAIVYLAPVIVLVLAGPLLKEKVGPSAWLAAALGFGGVLLIVRPGGGLDPLGVIFVLCNVVVSVGYYLLSRLLAHTERTIALLFYTALVGAIAFGILLPWTATGAAPSLLQIILFVSLGVSAALGHYMFTAAYRFAPAALLAPMNYIHLVWTALLGWLIFGHVPAPLSLAGMGLVAIAGVITATRGRRRPASVPND